MLIAVFGMRIVLPLAFVSFIADISPWAALNMAHNAPEQYAQTLASAHPAIMGFGGSFLLLVGLQFFLMLTNRIGCLGSKTDGKAGQHQDLASPACFGSHHPNLDATQ